MPKPWSMDLRERVMAACDSGELARAEIAALFQISEQTIYSWLRLRRAYGSVAPRTQERHGVEPLIQGELSERLRAQVRSWNDWTLGEYIDWLAREPDGVRVGVSTMYEALKRLGFTRKKKTLRASEQDTDEVQRKRRHYWAEIEDIDPERLVVVDESGADTRLTRTHARALSGERAPGRAPAGRRERLTAIAGVNPELGLVAPQVQDRAMTKAGFLAYLDERLVPELKQRKPDAVVVLDNLAAHRAAEVRETLEAAGMGLVYLPPYSPDLAPIEPAWSKVKTRLRAVGARGKAALARAFEEAMRFVSPEDVRNWFARAGYAV